MEDIIIDGVNLNELKVKYDALAAEQAVMRGNIRKGASKFISDAIESAKISLNLIVNAEDTEEINIEEVSQNALSLLENAKFVSDVSGVSYYLPYYDRQADYHPDGSPYTSQIEDSVFGDYDNKTLNSLWSLLEDMESDVSDWNTSYC